MSDGNRQDDNNKVVGSTSKEKEKNDIKRTTEKTKTSNNQNSKKQNSNKKKRIILTMVLFVVLIGLLFVFLYKPLQYKILIGNGENMQKVGDYETAMQDYRSAIELIPENAKAYERLYDLLMIICNENRTGNIDIAVGSYDSAMQVLEQAAANVTDASEAEYFKTLLNDEMGEMRAERPASPEDSISDNSVSENEADSNEADLFPVQREDIKEISQSVSGDYVYFGSYEQDGNLSNGSEPIEWYVVDKDGDSLLLFSSYVLDYVPYYDDFAYATWETSTIRTWLNDDFYNTAFSNEEKSMIIETTLSNPESNAFYVKTGDPWVGADGGNETVDKVFLFSYEELFNYYDFTHLNNDWWGYAAECIIAEATPYAESLGAENTILTQEYYDEVYYDAGWPTRCVGKEGTSWWLRSPGISNMSAMCVMSDGFVGDVLPGADYCDVFAPHGVRPLIWVKLR